MNRKLHLIDQIRIDKIQAMRNKDAIGKKLLQTLEAWVAAVGFEDNKRQTTDSEALEVIQKLEKDTVIALRKMDGRPFDPKKQKVSPDRLQAEIEILQAYLPQKLSEEELNLEIQSILAGLEKPNIGSVMKTLKAKHGSNYDGRTASQLIQAQL